MSRRADVHSARVNPFETPWQVAFGVLEDRRKTRFSQRSAMSKKAVSMLEGLAEEEAEQSVKAVMFGE